MEALLSRPLVEQAPTAATDTADPEPGTPAAVLPHLLPAGGQQAVGGYAASAADARPATPAVDGSDGTTTVSVAAAGSADFKRRQRLLALTGCAPWVQKRLLRAPLASRPPLQVSLRAQYGKALSTGQPMH